MIFDTKGITIFIASLKNKIRRLIEMICRNMKDVQKAYVWKCLFILYSAWQFSANNLSD